MYRILVADDEALIRQGIQCLLDYEALGFTICGEAASGEQALEKILGLQPDVVLMDTKMTNLFGVRHFYVKGELSLCRTVVEGNLDGFNVGDRLVVSVDDAGGAAGEIAVRGFQAYGALG